MFNIGQAANPLLSGGQTADFGVCVNVTKVAALKKRETEKSGNIFYQDVHAHLAEKTRRLLSFPLVY